VQQAHPDKYQQLLDEKLADLKKIFAGIKHPPLEVYASDALHFRMRAEFRIWHEDGNAYYAMNTPGGKRPYIISDFPIGSNKINELMGPLLEKINTNDVLKKKLFSAEFLTTLNGDSVITLIYHKILNEDWREAAIDLQQKLTTNIIGRSRKKKMVIGLNYVMEKLLVDDKEYQYKQVETGFTQPNAKINQAMLNWALRQTKGCKGDLLELYCGNGNFTSVLAQNFRKVLATEISKISVDSAHYNLEKNHIDNVTIARMSSEEITQALDRIRLFRRLKDIDLDDYNFSTIFVDPPRSGLDKETLKLVKKFDNILYVSCNPSTLMENITMLEGAHSIENFAVFDQFPYTPHLECGIFLKIKK
tara:strand:- start:25 stop:1107 length:1083 start_codon:yes stop_codon:yes gene_type:complete